MESLKTRGLCWSFLKEDEACAMESAVRAAVVSVMKVFKDLNDKRCACYELKLTEAERQNAALQIHLNEAKQELHSLQVLSSIPNNQISPEATLSFSYSPDFSYSRVSNGEDDDTSSQSVYERIALGPELKEEPLFESRLCIKTEVVDENCTMQCDPSTEHVDHNHLQTIDIQRFEAQNIFSQAVHQDSALNTTGRRRILHAVRMKRDRERIHVDPQKHSVWKEKDRLRKMPADDTCAGPSEWKVEPEANGVNPWPYLKDLFEFKRNKGNSYIMQCMLCLPKETELSAYKNSSSNLRKHVERKHSSKLRSFNDLVARRKQNQQPPDTPCKQAKINDMMPVGANICVPQAKIDRLIINFICEGLYPFSVVEQPAFKELLLTLNPQYKVISRLTVRSRIEEAAHHLKNTLMSHLSDVSYVATTTDCWTAHQQSYMGVTVHWIDEETFERRSAALACKRLKGSHTFDVLASALDDIHCRYKIRGKVVKTTTDSGSNFIKAFSVFGERSHLKEEESDQDSSSEESEAEYLDTFSILEQDNGLDHQLPTHQRCACHLLNLVATTDAAIAEENDAYKRLLRASFSKCQAFLNKSGWSCPTAEVVESNGKLPLIRPSGTPWNSTYLAVERIIQIIDEKGADAIWKVCEEFKVKMFSPVEIAFLTEYCSVVKPVMKSLNILQSETTTHMGWLLPVIFQLQVNLSKLETSSKMCAPLVRAIQGGVQKRFGRLMEDPELIAAAILLPKFKTTWTERDDIIGAGLVYVRQHLDQMAEPGVEQVRQNSTDEEDFFMSSKSKKSQGTVELDGYLACTSDKIDLLNLFPHIKKLSLKLNTALPASAACEHLFGCPGLLFTDQQTKINSTDFENQLLLKINKKFRE